MARNIRIEYPGALYHVTTRGNAGEPVFRGDADRHCLLALLADTVERFGWLCHAYCLMGNHYHLVIETPQPNLGRGMHYLNGVYTQRFNSVHGRSGHVFGGRYHAVLIEKESHFLEVARYVTLNPVRAGLAESPGAWPWSSYSATVGDCPVPPFLHVDQIYAMLKTENPGSAYGAFVDEGIGRPSPFKDGVEKDVFGGESFRSSVQKTMNRVGPKGREKMRRIHRRSLDEISSGAGGRGEWMADAYGNHGYTLTEIAVHSGLHISTVSRAVARFESATIKA